MIIQEDSRQKEKKHQRKHDYWLQHGDEIIRSKLPYGDYALPPTIAVDTKEDVKEIAMNCCGSGPERRRFVAECKLAKEAGAQLVFLIEDRRVKSIDDLMGHGIWLHSKRVVPGEQLAMSMAVLSERYGVRFEFCHPDKAAERIKQILSGGSSVERGEDGDGQK